MNGKVAAVLFLISLFDISHLCSQENNLNFFTLNRQNGLSDNSIMSIVKDDLGYMWFGTRHGLNRYDGYEFTKYYASENKNTLPGNQIEHLYITKSGELWIGTARNGVCRFNSQSESFITYHLISGKAGLGSSIIKGITESDDSTLFIATSEGVFYKENNGDTFQSLPFITDSVKGYVSFQKGLLSPVIATITADEKQGVWIIYEDWRLTYYNIQNDTYKHYSLQKYKEKYNRTIITVALHTLGKLYLSGIGPGLIAFNTDNYVVMSLLSDSVVLSANQLFKSSDSLLWLSTGNGLFHYNLLTNKYNRFTSVEADNLSMSTTSVNSVYEDDSGIIWVGSNNAGLNFAFKNKPFRHLLTGMDWYYTLSDDNVTEIMHAKNGNLWVCYLNGSIEQNDNQNQIKKRFNLPSLVGNSYSGTVFKLLQTQNGNIYAASWRGGVQQFIPEKSAFIPLFGSKEAYLSLIDAVDIRDIAEDSQGNLWLSAHGKGVYMVKPINNTVVTYRFSETQPNTLSNDWTFDISIDEKDTVWVGSAWGLSKIFPDRDSIQTYFTSDEEINLKINPIELVKIDSYGDLWISSSIGLGYYNQKADTFYFFNNKNGLPNEQVNSLLRDETGAVWAGTSSGLVKFNILPDSNNIPHLSDIYIFDYDDGLQSNFFNKGAAARNSEGLLHFGGRWGIDYFFPDEIQPTNIEPRIRINSFEIYGQTVYPGTENGPPLNKKGEVVLPYNQNMVGFKFAALNYISVQGNKYSYKLDPLNAEWIDIGNNRDLIFSNLKPGHYSLSLKVVSDKGQVHEHQGIFNFYIKSPFWQTAWFFYSVLLILISTIILSIRVYTGNLRKKKLQLEKTVQTRTQEIRQKNMELEKQSDYLNETNTLLEERSQQIEEQAEELQVQSDTLASTNEHLSELNSMKDKFFSIIAHDLKNPFNTILGFTGLLKHSFDEYPEIKRKQMIGYIHNSATSAYTLLENLLHWSRSQSNKLIVNPRKQVFDTLLDANYSLIKGMLKRKNLRFRKNIDPELIVWADTELLNTVLRNLLSNAAKFTSNGGVITVNSKKQNGEALIEIIDTGIGMDKDEVNNLFRIDASNSKRGTSGEEGTGLGVILCKEFVEKMNGRIWVESSKGIGTRIIFTLPLVSEHTTV